ncbi:SDR family oxidoreductase [bacterium]|nr:SDR family oxidoreductase [bacterium]
MSHRFDLKGRRALVTGGIRGIGFAIAQALGTHGAIVALGYRSDAERAQEAVDSLEKEGITANCFGGDLAQPEIAAKVVKEAGAWMEGMDIVVHSAGIRDDAAALFMSPQKWSRVLQSNLDSAFYVAKNAGRLLMKSPYGRILFLSSVSAAVGGPGQANYAASKAGLEGLMRVLAREMAPQHITVNALSPGIIETELTENLDPKIRKYFLDNIPLGRMGAVDEVAPMALLLSSDAGAFITGQVIEINGGMSFS